MREEPICTEPDVVMCSADERDPIRTTLGELTLALRKHLPDPSEEVASGFERESVQIAAVESARLFTGSVDVAVRVRDKLRAMSDDEWWMYVFVLHPSICTLVHSQL